jgi:uncharacterized protein
MRTSEAPFLGIGWSFPPTFTRRGYTVVTTEGEANVRESLRVLFETAQGERVMLPTYGCALWRLVFRALTATFVTEVSAAVEKAVVDWEPRIDLLGVEVREDPAEEGLVTVSVDYLVRLTNTRSNLVFPFYLREGTLVPRAA